MAMLGKRRPPRPASGHSGLARTPGGNAPRTNTDQDTSPLVIERLAHDGRGIAHSANGKTVFIDHALPGEQVEVAIHLTRKRFDEAHVKSLLSTSDQRVSPPCPHFGKCGGCDLQHLSVDGQRAHKREVVRDLFSRQGITLNDIDSIQSGDQGYRRRARLGVKVDSQGMPRLGFRAAHSHRLVDIERCPVLVNSLQALLLPLRELLGTLDAPRLVGHIELLATEKAQVVLVRQLKEHAQDAELWQAFAQQQQVVLGTWLGRESPALHWHGAAPALEETLALEGLSSLTLSFEPGDFLQVNAQVNQQMIAQVLQWLAPKPGHKLLDLFAGIGNFSLPMAAAGATVHAVEGNPTMVERIATNAKRNRQVISGQQADLNDPGSVHALLKAHPDLDALILDPPRSGGEAICQALAHHHVPRVVYISCDPATLARDAAHLVHAGYKIKQVAVADMFLHTAHMETLMLFESDVIKHKG